MKQEILELQKQIDNGIDGKSIWIPIVFPKMGESVGIGKSIYTIIGGCSGTGKTAFTDLAYVLSPYSWMKKNHAKSLLVYHAKPFMQAKNWITKNSDTNCITFKNCSNKKYEP